MKRCAQCRRTYFDESLNFCLDDGLPLIHGPFEVETPTAILPSEPTPEGPTRRFESPPKGNAADQIASGDASLFHRRSWQDSLMLLVAGIILVAGAVAAGYWFFRPQAKQIDSIAVMPFSNDSGTVDAEYLSDGITDSLINSLSKI